MEKNVLTTGEIAKFCNVNLRTVARWVERGELKAYQLPGRGDKRIEIPDFLAFLKRHNMPIPDAFQEDGSTSNVKTKQVLIVDDDRNVAASIQRVLRNAGFETHIAHNGFEAGALLATIVPDLMTLDMRMPGMNGMEVLKTIRGNERLKDVKVVVISGLEGEALEDAKKAGAHAVLSKPCKNDVLLETLQTLLE